ncbi:MAG: TlpA disulfide reductase family protein [Negativicutes bacterium]|nr:TlpA disulfide reductase family protein [Negativicutes bacterium]
MARKLVVACIFTALFLLNGLVCYAETGVTVGKTLPQFTLSALDGQSVTVGPSDQVTVINFWATWCPPCRGEMPDLNAFYLQYQGKVNFYAIDLQEDSGKVKSFMQNNGYSMPVLLDTDGEIGNLFHIQAIPTTIIVDRNGVIQFVQRGATNRAQLENRVNQLL